MEEKPVQTKTVDRDSFSAKRTLVFKVMFFCLLACSLLIGFYLTEIVWSISETADARIQYIENWIVIDEAGNCFDVGRTYVDKRAYDEQFTIISKLPDDLQHNSELCFMNRSDISVFINGKLRKDFKKSRDTGIPGGSMKEFYIMIPLSPADSGAELKMVREKTDWNPTVVFETFVSTPQGINKYLINKYGVSFVFEVVLLITSMLVTILGFMMRFWNKRTINMLYAALGVLIVACWLISVSQLTPFVTSIYYVDGVMGFFFCMMMPLALLIYINSIQKNRYRKLHTILYVTSVINYLVWTVVHFSGIRTFQSSLVYIDSVLGIVVLCVLTTLILDIKNGKVREYPYTALGFLCFMVMCIMEIVMLIFFEEISNEIPMLIGLMCLLVLVVIQQIDDLRKFRMHLEDEIVTKTLEKEQMLIHIVRTLTGTIDAKDTYTNGHSSRVADYTREIAKRYGYSESDLNDIYMMGLLHDIGKIGVPDVVINKPSKLSDEEYEIIKRHPVVGANILKNIREKTDLEVGARWHHERYDGKGYPDGLKGEEIPEQARIIAVADAYDAMTSYRSYRDPMSQETVKQEIEKGSGTQFDPTFAKIMLEMIDEDNNYVMREKKLNIENI